MDNITVSMATRASENGTLIHLDHIVYFSLSINLLTIVAGNIALLVFVSSRPKSRMTYYITNLGVADLCVGIFCVLPQFIDRVLMQFYGPEILCKLKFFTQTTVSYGAAYALVVLSIDRVDAIANPLRASTSRRKCQTASLIAGSWILSALYSSPFLLWTSVRRHDTFGRQCSIRFGSGMNTTKLERQNFWQIFVTANLVTIIIIPVTIVAICHIVLIVIIFRSGRGPKMPGTSGTNSGGGNSASGGHCRKSLNRSSVSNRNTITRAKIKTVKVTCTIVSVFILCWLPYTVGNFLDIYHVTRLSIYFKALIQTLGTLNSAANPIIFFIFNYNQCCSRSQANGNRLATAPKNVATNQNQQQQLQQRRPLLEVKQRQSARAQSKAIDEDEEFEDAISAVQPPVAAAVTIATNADSPNEEENGSVQCESGVRLAMVRMRAE